jgi:thymidylate synthase (FAD)
MTDEAMKRDLISRFGDPIPVLNHGFIRLVDVMGDDGAIVQAARVSYGKGTKKDVNEYSARYSEMSEEFFLPDIDTVSGQDQKNRQSRGTELPPEAQGQFIARSEENAARAWAAYQASLKEGVARELARADLPLSNYTEWYWKIDLHNLLHFLSLRLHSHAQYEIRVFAEAMAEIVKVWVPHVWEAFEDYRLNGMFLSRGEVELLAGLLGPESQRPPLSYADGESNGLSKREMREFCGRLGYELSD